MCNKQITQPKGYTVQLDLFSLDLDELQTVARERAAIDIEASGASVEAKFDIAEVIAVAKAKNKSTQAFGEWWQGSGLTYGHQWRAQLIKIGRRSLKEGRPDLQSLEIAEFSFEKYAAGVHVGNNSGNEEWYTNRELIEAARETMGTIDCDPASNDIAQATVKAGVYYTATNSGLTQPWHGNVWLNPPYTKGLVDEFITKLLDERPPQWCVLTNNSTDTGWWQRLTRAHAASSATR